MADLHDAIAAEAEGTAFSGVVRVETWTNLDTGDFVT